MVTGIVTTNGAAVRHNGATVPLPKARTEAGKVIAAIVAKIDSGELTPCPNCNHFDCECWEWVELMTAPPPVDPHDDLSWRESVSIPY